MNQEMFLFWFYSTIAFVLLLLVVGSFVGQYFKRKRHRDYHGPYYEQDDREDWNGGKKK